MLRDESNNGPSRRPAPRNVFGEPLEACSIKPMTGFYRDGCCNTGREDVGSHTVCVVMTSAFLGFSKSRGNDLSTPVPAFGFPGLKPGDRWCSALALVAAYDAHELCRVMVGASRRSSSCALAWSWMVTCNLAHTAILHKTNPDPTLTPQEFQILGGASLLRDPTPPPASLSGKVLIAQPAI